MSHPVYTNHSDQLYVKYEKIDNPDAYVFDTLHAHQYHEIIYFEKGGGAHYVDTTTFAIKDHSLHILKAGTIHKIDREIHSRGFAFVYNDAFLLQLQQLNPTIPYWEYFYQNQVIDLSAQAALFRHLFKELTYPTPDKAYHINLIGLILTKICITCEAHKEHYNYKLHPKVLELYKILAQHFLKETSSSFYAERMHLSESGLYKLLRHHYHKSFSQMLKEHRLLYAKKELLLQKKNISEIAFDLGFNDTAYFSNWFKKNTGVMPSSFHRLHHS